MANIMDYLAPGDRCVSPVFPPNWGAVLQYLVDSGHEYDQAIAEINAALESISQYDGRITVNAQTGADNAAAIAVNAANITQALGMQVYAVCDAPAAPTSPGVISWYVPKSLPRPAGVPGMMVDVKWSNGHSDGIGYDLRLIWGAPDAEDNEIIVEAAPASSGLTGQHSVPAEGTVRYQLIEQSGRLRWHYVSGQLLPKQFSSDTAADTPVKIVPGLELQYLPGMQIYLQLDNGNTADVMTIGAPALPVYGNGTGRHTGIIYPGYIMQLVNAGDHWQLLNGPQVPGRYELIESITAGPDEIFWRTKEPDGTPYKFRAVMVKVYAGNSTRLGFALYAKNSGNSGESKLIDATCTTTDKGKRALLQADSTGTVWDCKVWGSTPSNNEVQRVATTPDPIDVASAPYITGVREWGAMAAGTVIQIYAIRG